MRKNSWLLISALVITLLVTGSSCDKDDDVIQTPVTRAQLLARSWKQTDLLASVPGGSPTSVFLTVMEACQRDNIWTFKSDGTYIVTEGATKCNAADPDTATTGTWVLTDSDTKITIDDVNEAAQTFSITELTSSSLKINGNITYGGTAINGTAVFQPQ